MKLAKKTMTALFLLGAGVASEVVAQESVKVSGYIDANLEYLSSPKDSATRVSSGGLNSSRLVFSGTEDLGGGNKAFFEHQIQVAVDTGVGSPRESYVGVRGNWGSLSGGRQATPSYWIVGYADPSWSSDYSRVSNNVYFYAPYRESNSILYVTPTMAGFKGRFMATAGKEDGTKNGRVVSLGGEYRNGGLYLGLVSDQKYTQNIFSKVAKMETARDTYLSAAYKIGSVEPTFIYHTYDGYYAYPPYVDFKSKGWDVQLGARWAIDSTNSTYISYVHRVDDSKVDIGDADSVLLGYNYSLSKRTTLYATYSKVNAKNTVSVDYPVTFSSQTATQGMQFGIRHAF
jgi:predicted porin